MGPADLARQHGAEVIKEPRKGKGNAVQRLFREAHSDYLIMVDGDDTYPAEEALKLIATIEKEGGDTIVGRRTSDDEAAFKTLHTWANKLLARFIEAIFHAKVGDLFSGFRLFTKTFYKSIPVLATGFEVEAELALQTIDKGFTQRDIAINFRSRPEGSFSKLDTVQRWPARSLGHLSRSSRISSRSCSSRLSRVSFWPFRSAQVHFR